ncbi:hypothetical protein BC938DRAFT_473189 [Jimgerdemannia flammicorona]|uniref:Uncharacterized protein n=1 Tax=Jimgerdemannia flammicorona TaxID=994334 RepID=A0A433Q4H3_9FUNG|nr:hypothetical protein BC938DRAFT_473189 [Jimgerdemannia flammicorona]
MNHDSIDVLRAALAHSGALIKEKIMQRRYRQQTPLMHSPSTASLQSNSSSTSLDEMEATNLLTVGLTSQVGVDLASDPVPDGPTVEIFRPANDPISLDDEIEDSESDSDTDDDFDHDITEIIDEADDSSIHSNNSTSDQSHTAKDNVDGKRKRHLLGWRFGRQQKTEDLTTDKDSNESDSTSSSAQSGKKTVTRGRALSVGSQEHQAQPINQQQPLDDEFQQKSKLLLGRLYSPGVNSQMSLQSTSGHNFTDLTGKDPNGISNGDEKQ